jgi:hypothetical protein
MDTAASYAFLLDGGFLKPSKVGAQHLLFSKVFATGLVGEVISPTRETLKMWDGGIDRLISLLMEWSLPSPLWTFGVVEHDCCFAEIVWPHQIELQKFVSADLAWLQTLEVSDNPVVQIGITTAQKDWLVLFERRSGLEIGFHGPDEKWAELLPHLSTTEQPTAAMWN